MSLSRRNFLQLGGATALLAAWGGPFAKSAHAGGFVLSRDDSAAYHFLNRISYGVREEDLALVNKVGIEAYLDEQLKPETIKGATHVRVSPVLKLDRLKAAKMKNAAGKAQEALVQGMVERAAFSPAQLLERMVEFWSDHFNIASVNLETDVVDFQREVIRKNALGKFHDLLIATAHHPAMLFFLNNNENVAKHPNENYARELMELHTLGVDNGYTESDVKAVARAFTGWTVKDDVKPGGFFFRMKDHDAGPKSILGNDLPVNQGVEDGNTVLEILAGHPNTARFVCKKLCIRFVSDFPPQSLIDNLAAVWMQNQGEITPVLKALFLSPEFAGSVGQKLRRPLDFFVGAMRLTTTDFKDFNVMQNLLSDLSQVPYNWIPPNGYPDVAAAWANTGGLLNRWNTAQTLTDSALNNKKSGMTTKLAKSIGKPVAPEDLVDNVAKLIFAAKLPDDIRAQLIAYVVGKANAGSLVTKELLAQKLGTLTGLMLSSPMFQWR